MDHKLTAGELDILQIIWKNGKCTVKEVHDVLSLTKETGYTSTLKQMQVMNEKGILSRDVSTRTHVYRANLPKEQVSDQLLKKIINTIYGGSSAKLVMQVLGNHNATNEELDAIKNYLDELKK